MPRRQIDTRTQELIALLAIMVIALVARFYHLTTLPTGFHGDEAVAGLEAERLLRDHWIGPYTPLALGQPTGTIHLVALSIVFFGHTIWAVRFVSAVVGTLTVLLLYGFLRRHLGVRIAQVGSLLLAVLTWHVHFSRIGFPLITWPFCAVLAAMALLEAVRSHDWRWWAASGAAVGVGVYSYSAHPLFVAITFLFAFYYVGTVREVSWTRRGQWLAAMLAAFLIVSYSMIVYALDPSHDFFSHTRTISQFQTREWETLHGFSEKVPFLLKRYWLYWDVSCFHPKIPTIGDATGAAPIYPPLLLLLALIGFAVGLYRKRDPLYIFGAMVLLIMPLSFVATTFDLTRRTFAAAPFLVMFAALGIREIVHAARRRGISLYRFAVAGMACVTAFIMWQNVYYYFVQTALDPYQESEYCEEYTAAVYYMRSLPPGSYVYFASDRWSINYEPRQFLAPEVHGEDRSSQFNPARAANFRIDPTRGKPVFVLVGSYRSNLMDIWKLYPGGKTIRGKPIGSDPGRSPTFIAYIPPVKPVKNAGPPPPPF
jgi:4-amino-4-deoxy-L-arabinose transferase-like glycosyltransferase